MLHQVVILKTVQRNKNYSGEEHLSPSRDLIPTSCFSSGALSEKACVGYQPWPSKQCPMAFTFCEVCLVADHKDSTLVPIGSRVPKLTLENSNSMSLPIINMQSWILNIPILNKSRNERETIVGWKKHFGETYLIAFSTHEPKLILDPSSPIVWWERGHWGNGVWCQR